MRKGVVAVRCFAEQTAGQWKAHCVDLGLTVQGDTLETVKSALDSLIHEHIDGALTKRSRAHAPARPPLAMRLRYWGLFVAGRLGLRTDALRDGGLQRPGNQYGPRMAARSAH